MLALQAKMPDHRMESDILSGAWLNLWSGSTEWTDQHDRQSFTQLKTWTADDLTLNAAWMFSETA